MSLSNLTLLILAIIILILSIIKAGSSSLVEEGYKYSIMQKRIKELKLENMDLREQVLLYESFTHIHKEAVDNLKMVVPTIYFLH